LSAAEQERFIKLARQVVWHEKSAGEA